MLGIENIGSYIPQGRLSNFDRKAKFKIDDHFIQEKIGVCSVSTKDATEETSDLAVKAFEDLEKRSNLSRSEIEALIVVTQNPDINIPHVSAIVHGKLALPESCACFDISLGCSGFVYSLSVLHAFMKENGLRKGVLLTADPYSKIVDPEDKNTTLLFGDAAAATLISEKPVFTLGKFSFGTLGAEYEKLMTRDGVLYMNGRAVFNFAAKTIPGDLQLLAQKNGMDIHNIDRFLLHQGSKIIVETIASKLSIPMEKVPYIIHNYGNTVSSTIPLLLQHELEGPASSIAMTGFGVGLSWASGLLFRV